MLNFRIDRCISWPGLGFAIFILFSSSMVLLCCHVNLVDVALLATVSTGGSLVGVSSQYAEGGECGLGSG